jgi:hypothetical protein
MSKQVLIEELASLRLDDEPPRQRRVAWAVIALLVFMVAQGYDLLVGPRRLRREGGSRRRRRASRDREARPTLARASTLSIVASTTACFSGSARSTARIAFVSITCNLRAESTR